MTRHIGSQLALSLISLQNQNMSSSRGQVVTPRLVNPGVDPRRPNRIYRYKPSSNKPGDDPTADYLNLMGMIFSMCGLMMRVS